MSTDEVAKKIKLTSRFCDWTIGLVLQWAIEIVV